MTVNASFHLQSQHVPSQLKSAKSTKKLA